MKTPLYNQHLAAHAKIAPFGDWDMPIHFSGIIDEHLHTRRAAGIFDICHMGEFMVHGPQARDNLNRLITAKFSALKTGRCKYGFLLNDNGGVLDDLITYQLDDDRFMLVVNSATSERDREWIQAHLSPDTAFEDISEQTAKIDLQGPQSCEILQPLCSDDISNLKYFHFMYTTAFDASVLISRTGYTGEFGYELYLPVDYAVTAWQTLLADERVKPVGLGARDTLRLECGLPLYGHELGLDRSPVSAGMLFAIDCDKDFIGKQRVIDDIKNGTPDVLAGLALSGRQAARPRQSVTATREPVGIVTSGSFAPSLGHAVALAYVAPAFSKPDINLAIDAGRKDLPATSVSLPFYTQGTARR